MDLKNQFAVVLFDRLKTKQTFYVEWFKQLGSDVPTSSILGVDLGPPTASRANDIIILECGPRTLRRMINLPLNCKTLICASPEDLVKTIRMVMEEPAADLGGCRLNTFVVENLSAFYWDKRCGDKQSCIKWYRDVNELLATIKKRFKCNVVVTMWDLDFERGFKSRHSRVNASNRTLSYTPNELFSGSSYSLSYKDDDVYQYLEGLWHRIL